MRELSDQEKIDVERANLEAAQKELEAETNAQTGACIIRSINFESCVPGVTKKVCDDVGKKYGVIPDWRPGQQCPR